MQHFSEKWFQEVAESARLSAISPEVINTLLPIVELQIRKIIQLANKHQRRSKSKTLKVEDINLALTTNKIEPIYGLHLIQSSANSNSNVWNDDKPLLGLINVTDYANTPLPPCPLLPSLSLHWLAVKGVQPAISENPTFIEGESDHQYLQLPKELQYLYSRITGIILNTTNLQFLNTLYTVLRTDTSMQELLPYLSRFFYLQIKANSKRLSLLRTIIKSIHALHQNNIINFEAQLQQLLPAIFTCVVGSKLSLVYTEDHWDLRLYAAKLIADLAQKYSSNFPDLHARICKTYIEAVSQKSSLSTIYGGVIGFGCLGVTVIKTVLLPQLSEIHDTIVQKTTEIEAVKANSNYFCHEVSEGGKKRKFETIEKQREYLSETELGLSMCKEGLKLVLGQYMTWNMQLPSLPWSSSNKRATAVRDVQINVCDLEEALVAYYAVHTKDLHYLRLMI